MRSGVPQGVMMGSLLLLLFVNDLPYVLEALALLFVDDVEVVTQRTQYMNRHSSPTAVWGWSKKWELSINPTK